MLNVKIFLLYFSYSDYMSSLMKLLRHGFLIFFFIFFIIVDSCYAPRREDILSISKENIIFNKFQRNGSTQFLIGFFK